MAKIEIFARPVKNFEIMGKYAPQHLYIVHTKDNGERIAYRGGPEKGNYHKDIKGNEFRDNLKVSKVAYNDKHPDYPEEGTSHPKKLSIEGNDQLVNPYIEKMESKPMKWINDGNFDYKVLIGQNSNAAVRKLIEGAGLEFGLPEYEDGTKVIAPQWGSEIEHTLIDKTGVGEKAWELYDKLNEKIAELFKKYDDKISQVKKDMAKEMGITMEEMDKKLEKYLELVDKAALASKLAASSGNDKGLFPEKSLCTPFTDKYKSNIRNFFNDANKSLLKAISSFLIEKKEREKELDKELGEKLDRLQKELEKNIEKERTDTEEKLKAKHEIYSKELNKNISSIKDKYKAKMVDSSKNETKIRKEEKEQKEQINNAFKADLDDIYNKYEKKLLNYEDLLDKFENAVYKDIERDKEFFASRGDINKMYYSVQEEEKQELENKINDLCNKYAEKSPESADNINSLLYNLCISDKGLLQADSDSHLIRTSVFSIVNKGMIDEGIRRNEELYKNELSGFMKSFKVLDPNLNITEKMKGFIITLAEKSKGISKHIGTSVKEELLKESRSAFVSASNKIKEAKEASKIAFNTSLLNLYKSEEEKYLAYYKESIESVIDAYSKKEAMSSLDTDFNTFESDAHDLLNSIYGLSSPHDDL